MKRQIQQRIRDLKVNGGTYYKKNYTGVDFKFYPYIHKKTTFWIA